MLTIHKYALSTTGLNTIELPHGGVVRHVGVQGHVIMLWVEVNTINSPSRRVFRVFATGEAIPEYAPLGYIGTVQKPTGTVWHVYEYEERYR